MTCLEEWNAMSAADAADAVMPCCGSTAWAATLAARRPLQTLPDLLVASDSVWWSLAERDWTAAFESHPRIGESHAQSLVADVSLSWSAGEQSSAMLSDSETKRRVAAGNQAYEERFGRIFIVCATGKSSHEILAILERRMRNTFEAELHETAKQQCEIIHIRLQKWIAANEQENAR